MFACLVFDAVILMFLTDLSDVAYFKRLKRDRNARQFGHIGSFHRCAIIVFLLMVKNSLAIGDDFLNDHNPLRFVTLFA